MTGSHSAQVADLVRPWVERPSAALVVTDFDGTLAPVVDDPSRAIALPGAVDRLADLAARGARVAVVSGRPASFLAQRLAPVADRLVLVGLYGLERLDRGRVVTDPAAEAFRPVVAATAAAARASAPGGVTVEDKGLAVTLHTRGVPDGMGWAQAAAAAGATLGLAAHPGKMSIELRPPLPVDKGTVVQGLAVRAESVCYLGDDLGDLPAFAALSGLRAAGRSTLSVAVGGDEAPAPLLRAADVVVDGPAGALALLAALAGS